MKRLKHGTSDNLLHRKRQNMVPLRIYFIENAEIRCGWTFIH